MIASLTGRLTDIGLNDGVIMVGGVGYRFQAAGRCLSQLGSVGDEVTLLIDTQIKDDRIILTGFSGQSVQTMFGTLQRVQGVGAKAALAILSALSPDDIVLAISTGDKAMITRADGVGPKLAQRIVNELSDKISAVSLGGMAQNPSTVQAPLSGGLDDSISALVNLGYGRAEAHAAVMLARAEVKADNVEALLPAALKALGR